MAYIEKEHFLILTLRKPYKWRNEKRRSSTYRLQQHNTNLLGGIPQLAPPSEQPQQQLGPSTPFLRLLAHLLRKTGNMRGAVREIDDFTESRKRSLIPSAGCVGADCAAEGGLVLGERVGFDDTYEHGLAKRWPTARLGRR